jgi:ankyrin repeat protein
VQLLLKKGADVNIANVVGMTPLHTACYHNNHSDVVVILLDIVTDINAKTNVNQTALYLASAQGNTAVVEHLLHRGADINTAKENGWTPLHAACKNGHRDAAAQLLDAGSDIKAKDATGQTSLYLTCSQGHEGIVELLLGPMLPYVTMAIPHCKLL